MSQQQQQQPDNDSIPTSHQSTNVVKADRLNLNSYTSSIGSSPNTLFSTPNGAITSPNASALTNNTNQTPQTNNNTSAMMSTLTNSERKKIGHREVKHGVVLYKKVSTDELKRSIQFGIVHFINERNRDKMDRDLLMQDFQVVENIVFPRTGSVNSNTPAHDFNDFKLKVYAPYGFKYLRRKFNLNEVDFMHALGETDLIEISNPGASGSVFYKTSNDKYILKTVQYQECEFLKTLLAGYALNLLQNLINGKFSLLPTIYGLFCYQKLELTSMLSDKTNIRVVIMNNILPSDVPIHEKYDLKGSTYKRKASKAELAKKSPTYKDIDFLEEHKEGLILDEKHYENIISSLKRDCLILQSFGIMDYSMLLGIHNIEKERINSAIEAYYEAKVGDPLPSSIVNNNNNNNEQQQQPSTSNYTSSPIATNSHNKRSSINSKVNLDSAFNFNISAVPARSGKGERLLLYFGIIDILQSYRLKKKLEHSFKSLITDGRQISVCHPTFYANRFIEFMTTKVFKKSTLKGSPTRKRLTFRVDPKKDTADQLTPPSPNTHEPISSLSISPHQPQPQQQRPQQLPDSIATPTSTTATTYKQNLKDLKSIDSMDSVAGLLTTSESKNKLNNYNSKFSNIVESSDDVPISIQKLPAVSSSLEERRNLKTHPHTTDYLNDTRNDNDNVNTITNNSSSTTTTLRRSPITPIIRHDNTNKTSNQQLATSSISIKLETHSPTHLKSFNNYTPTTNAAIAAATNSFTNDSINGKSNSIVKREDARSSFYNPTANPTQNEQQQSQFNVRYHKLIRLKPSEPPLNTSTTSKILNETAGCLDQTKESNA